MNDLVDRYYTSDYGYYTVDQNLNVVFYTTGFKYTSTVQVYDLTGKPMTAKDFLKSYNKEGNGSQKSETV